MARTERAGVRYRKVAPGLGEVDEPRHRPLGHLQALGQVMAISLRLAAEVKYSAEYWDTAVLGACATVWVSVTSSFLKAASEPPYPANEQTHPQDHRPRTATFMNGPPGTTPRLHHLFDVQVGWVVFALPAIPAGALLIIASPPVFGWYKASQLRRRSARHLRRQASPPGFVYGIIATLFVF